jgi:hypothetical protein
MGIVPAAALLVGFAASGSAMALPSGENMHWRQAEAPRIHLAQRNLPSDVEQRLGIRPNSRNWDSRGRGDWRDHGGDRSRRYGYYRGGYWDGPYGRPRITVCRTRYQEWFDPYRGVYIRRPVRECR